jgi:hypothetical protein
MPLYRTIQYKRQYCLIFLPEIFKSMFFQLKDYLELWPVTSCIINWGNNSVSTFNNIWEMYQWLKKHFEGAGSIFYEKYIDSIDFKFN